jgi:hypothetical protein
MGMALLVFGFCGLFLRHLDTYKPYARYFATYHWLVRSSFIGAIRNGRRNPCARPRTPRPAYF